MLRGGASEGLEEADYGTRAFLAVRARFFLAYRLTLRLTQLAAPDGGTTTPGWTMLLGGFVALDIALWALLRKPERLGLKARLVIDSIDVAVWSLAPYGGAPRYDMAIYAAVPLALEAGVRRGAVGLVVPAVALAVTAAVRSVLDRPVMPAPFLWLVLAVGCGMLLAHYLQRLHRRVAEEWSQRRSAEAHRAFLAGQNAVAMGASSAVDGIEGVIPILGPPATGSCLWQLAGAWKFHLYQSTSRQAVYLADVLREWSRDHNRHPDLSRRVELHLAEGLGTTLLTGDQAAALHRMLSGLDLRGQLPVEFDDTSALRRPPGGPVRFRVGKDVLAVPADSRRPPRPYDPGPAVFLIGAGLMLADWVVLRLPLMGVLPQLALALAGTWWADRELRRKGTVARPSILVAAVLVVVSHTAIATATMRAPLNAGGLPNYAVVVSLDVMGLLGGMYWRSVSKAARCLVPAAVVLVLAVGWLLHPNAGNPAYLALQASWLVPFLVSGLRLELELERGAARYSRHLALTDAAAEVDAFRRGQAAVVDLVRQARDEAREQLTSLRATLPRELYANAQDRLKEVDRRLEELTAGDGSSWSTTTS